MVFKSFTFRKLISLALCYTNHTRMIIIISLIWLTLFMTCFVTYTCSRFPSWNSKKLFAVMLHCDLQIWDGVFSSFTKLGHAQLANHVKQSRSEFNPDQDVGYFDQQMGALQAVGQSKSTFWHFHIFFHKNKLL